MDTTMLRATYRRWSGARNRRNTMGQHFGIETLEPRQLFSTFTVNTLSDSSIPKAGFLTLRQAVTAANLHAGADTITFSAAVFPSNISHTIALTNGELLFTDKTGTTNVTGPGASVLTVNGNANDRVIEVAKGVSVSLSDLTLTNGSAFASDDGIARGGGINNAGALVLSKVVVTKNNAFGSGGEAFGGGVFSSGLLVLANSAVSNNFVQGDDFGSAAAGGGIYSTGSLSVTGGTISGNAALCALGSSAGSPATGGGIETFSSAAFNGVTISDNSVFGGDSGFSGFPGGGGYGGGIYAHQALTITASTISNNRTLSGQTSGGVNAASAGGGVYVMGTLTLKQSTVSGNVSTGGNASYDGASGSEASGGGILAMSTVTILQSSITGNRANGGAGNGGSDPIQTFPVPGGDASGGGLWAASTVVITDSTIANNTAAGGSGSRAGQSDTVTTPGGDGGNAFGGGIYVGKGVKFQQISDSTVSGNASVGGVGGYGYDAPPGGTSAPPGAAGVGAGGGLYSASATLLYNSILSANQASPANDDIAAIASPSSSNNLIGHGGGLVNGLHGNQVGITNPQLSPLGNYGGLTQTMVPLPGSPAIDKGNNSLIPVGIATDQRGAPRIAGAAVDIGAVESSKVVISGAVFNDINGDGIRQSTDPGLSGWQVYVDLNNSGVFAVGDPIATTDASGHYVLTYSPLTIPSTFIVREIRQNNWRRTKPAGIYPLGYYAINSSAASAPNTDFGDSATGLVIGTVYHDTNGNGVLNPGEAGLAGWTVDVDQLISGVWHQNVYAAKTDSSGNYLFVLNPGIYRIHEVAQSGLVPTIPPAAGYNLTLVAGATVTGENFGNK